MNCLFCSIARGGEPIGPTENEVLDETAECYLKPGLGALVEGYSLIITKTHHLSFGSLGESQLEAIEAFKNHVTRQLEVMYGLPVMIFEHGEAGANSHAGSCMRHAHLHLLPSGPDLDITPELCSTSPLHELAGFAELDQYSKKPYLYYERMGKKLVFTPERDLPCQFVRRLIARKLGRPETWDWIVFPFRERIDAFKRTYRNSARLRSPLLECHA